MIERRIEAELRHLVDESPAVALLGQRQVGKSTLALNIGETRPSIYLDLESEAGRAKLSEPKLHLANHGDKLVILDEVHRLPNVFQILRSLIDRNRRSGLRTRQFLLLGWASIDLLKQSGETLAGRIAYLEMQPVDGLEVPANALEKLWLRGGLPDSFLASSDRGSMRWRQDFIRTYLERDIPLLGPRIPAETLRRFWTMLAHHHSGLPLLVDLLLVRRLEPWHANIGKRLVKSPKIYVGDSGIAHALLGLGSTEQLLGHPIVGASWEGFVIETLVASSPHGTAANFYRTAAGAEIDLLLTPPGQKPWAIEIKRSLSPKLEKGFHLACEDLQPIKRIVIYPGAESFPLPNDVTAMSLPTAGRLLQDQ
ncbi:ATP-binding protein [Agrobacterium fabrum]|uniref:ATP-binding protein n=1 Tax=Agrobacterium fabrum TaxID=1176649 RepID=UPI0024DF8CD9|nr:ATP-binding protein [Agrobacterium fabrum]WIE30583.1 ATP-binding protein [Agrobacterium fabrum]WIE46531.1 ATP-binding protein [Agrobacterium fabrum]